ncbi:peptidoglycan-binding domain-containing protein [Phaeobacter porticola]|nr:peptidoglycan-binding domain-containing protein [Phaeobacter porticola]
MDELLRLRRAWLALGCLAVLSACIEPQSGPAAQVSRAQSAPAAPPGAPPGSCWSTHTTPAVIETVTVQVMTRPAMTAADGTVLRPARFRRETRQNIVRPRRESWFETPCPVDMTPQFVGSVQRALAVRGHYDGEITGVLDAPTRTAVRKFQEQDGFANDDLSLVSARKLGLVAIEH